MARRTYDQYCSLATALDVVGERWTLLIVRELMLGPRRFKDLLHGLPGIGRNLLSGRLKHLEAEGIARQRQLPAPSGSRVYELTADGKALGPALAELGRWGVERLGERSPQQVFRASWGMFPLSYMADLDATRGVHEVYEFRIDEEVFHLRVDDGSVEPCAGPSTDPDLVVTMDAATLTELFARTLSPTEALAARRVAVDGSQEALLHSLALWPEVE
jgi:DNA-binding HxlR family transcriptional regulator